ncbi:BPI fold-containing family B member 2 isoform X2 [Sorex araneus]|uniref:BPI fold-containing family B member 2 isoform X2 n=1 Tax=Sorex araneus TaxID=42254 RepID=UPI002433460C|nr:BPI fold-containing family B member 2 isoform X2 [Sorex araneus]
MARVCRLGLLLALVLPVVGASRPGIVVRLNRAVLDYVSDIGKAPLQRALQVTVPPFWDHSGKELQRTRIQIPDVHISHLHLMFIAGMGIRVSAAANFTFRIFRGPEPLELKLPVELMADAQVTQSSIRSPLVSISTCTSSLGHGFLLGGHDSPPALLPLERHLKAVLRNKLCLSLASLVQDINVHLGTLIGLTPVGPESQIQYFMVGQPVVTNDHIALDINAVLFLLGNPIVLAVNATPFLPPQPVGAPGAMVTLCLSQDLFDSALLLLQKAGALNLDVTGQLKSDENPLNTSWLGQFIPEVTRQFPKPMPVVLKVRLGATPEATLSTGNATMRLQPFVEVLVATSNSAFQSLFSMDVEVDLSLQLSVSKVKLRGFTSVLGDVQITMASSNVGFVDPDQVRLLMGPLFKKPLLNHLNALLGLGIALPHMLHLQYVPPEVFIHEGYVVVSSGLSYER